MKNVMRKRLAMIIRVALILTMALSLVACKGKSDTAADTSAVTETAADSNVLGEGAVEFTFEVVDGNGNTTEFTINTDKKTVGEALQDVSLIEGEDSEYGLYVKTVNGITADYDVDQTYWAFYIDGEYASTGVDSTDVVAGSTYSFKVEK